MRHSPHLDANFSIGSTSSFRLIKVPVALSLLYLLVVASLVPFIPLLDCFRVLLLSAFCLLPAFPFHRLAICPSLPTLPCPNLSCHCDAYSISRLSHYPTPCPVFIPASCRHILSHNLRLSPTSIFLYLPGPTPNSASRCP